MNVKFYKLHALPSLVQGTFIWLDTVDGNNKIGLYFGGVNGWEYLTNDTADLDVAEFALATDTNGVVTIKGIKEVDGKIAVGTDTTKDVTFAKVATTGAAADVTYGGNSDYSDEPDNVEGALDDLYRKVKSIQSGSVTSFATKTGDITIGNGLQMNSTDNHKVEVKASGYITTDATNGVEIDSTKVKDPSQSNSSDTKLMTEGAVKDVIEGLDVSSFAQAAITNGTGTSTLTINGISETDGKIATDSTTNKLDVAIDGKYNDSSNKIATQSTVTSAVNGLNANTVATATKANAASGTGETVTIKGVKETNGVIAQGEGTETFTIGDGALKLSGYGATDTTTDPQNPSIPTVAATDVFSANDTADSTIALGNEFVLDATNKTIGLRVNQAVAVDNNIATMKDIASLTGAMHYKGGVTAYPTPTSATKAGDTYVVTAEFTEGGTKYEVGDMLVANADGTSATYTVVQSNMTIGVANGQIAANDGALTDGNIVVATANGVATSSYTPANIASQAITVFESSNVVTVTDTLTVGGTAQQGQAFTITGADGIIASATGNAITLTADVDGTYGSSNKIATQSTVSTAIDGLDATVSQGTVGTANPCLNLQVVEANGKLTSVSGDLVWLESLS